MLLSLAGEICNVDPDFLYSAKLFTQRSGGSDGVAAVDGVIL